MPGFTYVAVDKRGKEKRGSIEADNKEKVIDILKNDGLIPVSVKEQGALNKEIDFSIGKKVKPRDLSVFCRQFVSITQAGVPMKEVNAYGKSDYSGNTRSRTRTIVSETKRIQPRKNILQRCRCLSGGIAPSRLSPLLIMGLFSTTRTPVYFLHSRPFYKYP